MAKFLTTSATNYYLEELIKNAKTFLVLISPFLKVSERMRELLVDKDRQRFDVRIVYGKHRQPDEINWLQDLTSVRVRFCKNLHAKCYLSEEACIITSMNLHNFSQVNNNEMGVYVTRTEDPELFMQTFEEAKRMLRISSEVAFSPRRRAGKSSPKPKPDTKGDGKISTSRLARKLGLKNADFRSRLVKRGLLEQQDGEYVLTPRGIEIGGEVRNSPRFGTFFLWPEQAFAKP